MSFDRKSRGMSVYRILLTLGGAACLLWRAWVRTMSGNEEFRADLRGMLVAFLCFIHCIAGPVLLSFAGLSSMMGLSEKLDPLFVLLSSAIAGFTLIPGWRRKHGRKTCLALFAAGILFLLVRRYTSRPVEIAATVFGAGLIVSAHALNIRFARRCRCCDQASAVDAPICTRGTGS